MNTFLAEQVCRATIDGFIWLELAEAGLTTRTAR